MLLNGQFWASWRFRRIRQESLCEHNHKYVQYWLCEYTQCGGGEMWWFDVAYWPNEKTNLTKFKHQEKIATHRFHREHLTCPNKTNLPEVSNSWILKDVGRNSLQGNRKKIAKFLMRTFTCRSTFLYDGKTQKWRPFSFCSFYITILCCIPSWHLSWLSEGTVIR